MNLLRIIAWKTPSQTAQRNSCKEVRKEPRDVRIFAGGKKTVSHQRLLPIIRNRHLKWMVSVLFSVWEDARVWAHRNQPFDIHCNYLESVSFFAILKSLQDVESSCGGRWLDSGQHSLFPRIAGNTLFTDTAGHIFLSTSKSPVSWEPYLQVRAKKKMWDFPGGLVAKAQRSEYRGLWVRSLVRELDSTCHN